MREGAGSRGKDGRASTPLPAEGIELILPSSPEYLSLLRSVARWFSGKASLTEKDAARVELAVVEATTNIIRHAYGGDSTRMIRIRFREVPDGLEVEFVDQGKGAPESELVGRDPSKLETGGLGIHMIKVCMDDFRYEALPGGGARLILRKRCSKSPDDSAPGGGGSPRP